MSSRRSEFLSLTNQSPQHTRMNSRRSEFLSLIIQHMHMSSRRSEFLSLINHLSTCT